MPHSHTTYNSNTEDMRMREERATDDEKRYCMEHRTMTCDEQAEMAELILAIAGPDHVEPLMEKFNKPDPEDEEEDIREFMRELAAARGFVKYTGTYEKATQDVFCIEDGNVYTQLWPNAGFWRAGGKTLCSGEDFKEIWIKDSPIWPLCTSDNHVRMEYSMNLLDYSKIMDDIPAYVKKRRPIADAEREQANKEHEEQQAREYGFSPHSFHAIPSRGPTITAAERKVKNRKRKAERQARKRNKRRK